MDYVLTFAIGGLLTLVTVLSAIGVFLNMRGD